MKSRYFHVRAPLMIRQFIGKKEITPAVIPELANNYGGCTILVESSDDPKYVKVRVAWCRYTDNYCRKKGREIIATKEPSLVEVENLQEELEGIEEQMLVSCAWPVRHDEQLLADCLGDYSRAARYFQPKEEKVAVAEGESGTAAEEN